MTWAENYVGGPADRTLQGNCLGLVRRILHEQFRKDFPNFLGVMRAARGGKGLPLRVTRVLRDGTLVVCGNADNPVRHVGVYCREVDRVVHAVTDACPGIVRAEPLWRLRLEWPWVTYAQVVST